MQEKNLNPRISPPLITCKPETIEKKISFLRNEGIRPVERIVASSIPYLKAKIDYMRSIGQGKVIEKDSKVLMQSLETLVRKYGGVQDARTKAAVLKKKYEGFESY